MHGIGGHERHFFFFGMAGQVGRIASGLMGCRDVRDGLGRQGKRHHTVSCLRHIFSFFGYVLATLHIFPFLGFCF